MRSHYPWIAILVALFLGGSWIGRASDRYVSLEGTNDVAGGYTTWSGAATNIQAAIDAAVADDTVWVSNGTYYLTGQLVISDAIALRSWTGDRGKTVIDGNYPLTTNRCIYLNHADALVDGFTLTNGWAPASSVQGGGVRMVAGTLRNCEVTGCFDTNTLNWSDGRGGGVYADGAHCLVEECRIVNNTAGCFGGGVYLKAGAQISNSWIGHNVTLTRKGSAAAGGIYIEPGSRAVGCTIVSNTAVGHAGGGAVLNSGGARLINCLITGNTGSGGGGIACANTHTNGDFNEVLNCTIAGNVGGGVYVTYRPGKALWSENTIIYANQGANIGRDMYNGGAEVYFHYTCTTPTNDLPGEKNIDANPDFVDTNTMDFRLTSTSVCVDAGTNRPWMEGAKDLDGKGRIDPFAHQVDIGCYEFYPKGTLIHIR